MKWVGDIFSSENSPSSMILLSVEKFGSSMYKSHPGTAARYWICLRYCQTYAPTHAGTSSDATTVATTTTDTTTTATTPTTTFTTTTVTTNGHDGWATTTCTGKYGAVTELLKQIKHVRDFIWCSQGPKFGPFPMEFR